MADADIAPLDAAIEDDADQLDLLDSASRTQPLRVDGIYIAGLERTKGSVVQKEFQDILKAGNIEEIRDVLDDIHEALMELDIFEDVDMSIEASQKGLPGKCDIVVRCKEKPRFHVKGGTYVQANEGTLELQATLRNTFGFAEQLQVSAEKGSKGSNEFSFGISRPRLFRLGGEPLLSDVRISQLFRNFHASSFTQRTRGAAVTVSTDDMRHSITYELGWRTLTDPSRRAAHEVQQHFGHSLKSSVTYTFRHSHWPTGFVSRGGHAWRSSTEVAGLGIGNGVLRFAKQRLQGFVTVPLPETRAYLGFGADVGLMVPLGPGASTRQTPISDRFMLGGPSSLRGFHANCIGPVGERRGAPSQDGDSDAQRRYDYLGGDLYAAFSAALNFPLPFEPLTKAGIRGHAFVNAGNTALLCGGAPGVRIQDSMRQFVHGFRLTAGVGLVLPIQQVGSLEVNFCKVLAVRDTDRPKHGIQLGFSPMLL